MNSEEKQAVATEAMRRLYEDPFWDARFGERGRKFALEDGLHHLGYLEAALEADDPFVLVKYAQWLRSVLVPRGMCSLHLAENLARIGDVLAERGLDGDGRARRFLEQACEGLRHPGPLAAERLADEALRETPTADGRELRVLASVLADALAAGQPELYRRHLAWALPWLSQRGLDGAALAAALRAAVARLEPAALRGLEP